MSDFNSNDINDLSQTSSQLKQGASIAKQAANTTKNATSKAASTAKSGISKAQNALNKKRQLKKSAKNIKKKKKKSEKATKRTVNAIRRAIGAIVGAVGGVFVVILIFAAFLLLMFSTVVSAFSSSDEASGSVGAGGSGYSGEEGFVQFAHEQKGNKGDKYWTAMNCSPNAWCAMYAGWLLREGAGVDLNEYGWSADVGEWCDALKKKGLYHPTGGSYIPSIGDIMFKGTSQTFRTHVGIVIGVENGKITTSEGNATAGSYNQTVVAEYTYDINDSSIVGYGHIPISFPSGDFSPRLTAPTADNKFFNDNTYNCFAGGAAGLFECQRNGELGNCTAYAYGRAAEILGKDPNLASCDAGDWYEANRTGVDVNGKHVTKYDCGMEPRLGAIMVLRGGSHGGHVAVVEQINSDGSIVTSESGYVSYFFKTVTRPKGDYGLGWSLQGFIYIYSGTSSIQYSKIDGLSVDEAKVYSYFTSKGFSQAAACAIMANIMAECSFEPYWYFAEYVPDAEGAPGNSGGICMWYDDNNARFRRDCPNWNKSIDAQIVYLYETIVRNDSGNLSVNDKYYYGASGIYSMLKSVPNTESGARDAAYKFCRQYENPSWGSEGKRMDFASNYWKKVKGK